MHIIYTILSPVGENIRKISEDFHNQSLASFDYTALNSQKLVKRNKQNVERTSQMLLLLFQGKYLSIVLILFSQLYAMLHLNCKKLQNLA